MTVSDPFTVRNLRRQWQGRPLSEILTSVADDDVAGLHAAVQILAERLDAPDEGNPSWPAQLPELHATKLTNAPVPSSQERALNVTFQISPTASALAIYNVELAVTLNTASVRLLIDGVEAGEALLATSLLSGLVSLSATSRQQLVGFVLPGQGVELVSAGTGTVTLVNCLELVF